ncbi:MAG: terpene cyclase/mutase family protein [Lacipirellulaceae bacterium]
MAQTDASMMGSATGAALPVAQPFGEVVREVGASGEPVVGVTIELTKPKVPAGELPAEDQDVRGNLPPLATFSDLLGEAPAWLLSAALHMIVLIIFGLLVIANRQPPGFLLQLEPSDTMGEDLEMGEFDMPLELDDELIEDAVAVDPQLAEVAETEVFTVDSMPTLATGLEPSSEPIRMSLSGREAGMKAALLAAYGGTGATQDAVAEGLEWLKRNQQNSGLWSLKGKYSDGVNSDNPEAATGMALLAFQGAGYTPLSDPKDPHTRVVTRAWYALLKRQDQDGNFYSTGRSHGRLYTQAICTIALCELYGMTRDEQYRAPAQLAVDYCVSVQGPEGGWKYFPNEGGDLSVTGWFVMALQSARMAGLNVPSETLVRINGFLDLVTHDGGAQYSYDARHAATPSMSAEGLLCRQYLGWKHNDRRLIRGADRLIKNLPSWKGTRNSYYWYYASQVCHHMEGKHWRTWNDRMKVVLPAHQVKKGRERGSWDPSGDVGKGHGGRLYVTCLSIYMLEVYYRHLPIYKTELLSGG